MTSKTKAILPCHQSDDEQPPQAETIPDETQAETATAPRSAGKGSKPVAKGKPKGKPKTKAKGKGKAATEEDPAVEPPFTLKHR